jgi:nucleoside 2-deoxyribosyltransferase
MIYLAGSINGVSEAVATDWRKEASCLLAPKHKTLSPLDLGHVAGTDKAELIVKSDLTCILASKALLVNCNIPSWGTGMEIFYAWQNKIPVFVFSEDPNLSPWIHAHSTVIGYNLAEAVKKVLEHVK